MVSSYNKIILEINEKNEIGLYPFINSIINENIEIVKLLIDYANRNKIILNLNEKNNFGSTPITEIMYHNNLEMFKILMKYSVEKGIKLIIDENVVEKKFSEKIYDINYHLKNITEIDSEILKLIYLYKNENKIKVIFSNNSYFLKKFNEFNKEKVKDDKLMKEELEIEMKMKVKIEKEIKEKELIKKELEKEIKEKELIKKN